MDASVARMPAGLSARLAEEALHGALVDLCGGSSWRGIARGLAWQVVASGDRDPRSIEMLADTAEATFGLLIDDALWAVERTVVETWYEFLEARPGEEEGALAAAGLDADEESLRLLRSGRERVLATLLAGRKRAA